MADATDVLVVVAGVPLEVEDRFGTALSKLAPKEGVKLAILDACGLHQPYTEEYAQSVYEKLVSKLKTRGGTREFLLANTKLVFLFLHKLEGSHTVLIDRFGVEALVSPLVVPCLRQMPLETDGQRGHLVQQMIRAARRAIRHARKMLYAIDEELNGRENKTCLLLPPKTFGKDFQRVMNRVYEAAANSEDTRSFVESLKSLRLHRDGRHYEGSGRLVFMSPSKSGPRHGLAPVWGDSHEPSCVVRGRLRFGASYSPRFHYDCPLRPGSSRRFPGCHRPRTLPPHRRHANVAPNDGIR